MRITNKMMTNNMLYNINSNKNSLSGLEEQYSTGLAIQRPSDDPIVAVRALKLRTNLSELNQYYQKNIPDAMSWMETTESALKTTSEIITKIHTYCVQGANDTFNEDDRNSIAINLKELKTQIYQEGNANYAGRYLFTGYKTNTSLVFGEESHDINYTITETIKSEDLQITKRIIDTCDISELDIEDVEDFDTETRPSEITVYRLRLAYDKLYTVEKGGGLYLKIPQADENGEYVYDDDGNLQYSDELTDADMNVLTSIDPSAYNPGEDEINYLEDTGELIIGSKLYDQWRTSDFQITYQKQDFLKNELRPEHYFECTTRDMSIEDEEEREEKSIHYTVEDQPISFEVTFNQKLTINVQGRDAFAHALGRTVDDIITAVNAVQAVQDKIEEISRALEADTISDEQREKLNQILDVLNTERDLKTSSI